MRRVPIRRSGKTPQLKSVKRITGFVLTVNLPLFGDFDSGYIIFGLLYRVWALQSLRGQTTDLSIQRTCAASSICKKLIFPVKIILFVVSPSIPTLPHSLHPLFLGILRTKIISENSQKNSIQKLFQAAFCYSIFQESVSNKFRCYSKKYFVFCVVGF